ncbi:MAG: DUF951 domain-containing protein [Clostridiales bacterium]|nr:DUF951 domain-containing protein [Clostridiales bacterium]
MQLRVGDLCVMKKKHPCGENRFVLLRVGADIRARCLGCGHEIFVTRRTFTKAIKSVEPAPAESGGTPVHD